jgi:hypothetical protein
MRNLIRFGLSDFDLCTFLFEFAVSFSPLSLFPSLSLFSLCSLLYLLNYKDPSVRRVKKVNPIPVFPHFSRKTSVCLSVSQSLSLAISAVVVSLYRVLSAVFVVLSLSPASQSISLFVAPAVYLSSICRRRHCCRRPRAIRVRTICILSYLSTHTHTPPPRALSYHFTSSLRYALTPECVYQRQ